MTITEPGIKAEHGHLQPDFVHFDDLDSMGTMHNSRYAVLLERALTTFWAQHGYTFRGGVPTHPDAVVAVAAYSISYRVPVLGTGPILIHLWGETIGRTSATYGFRFLSADQMTVHAEGSRVHIRLDQQTLRPAPWAGPTLDIYRSLQQASA